MDPVQCFLWGVGAFLLLTRVIGALLHVTCDNRVLQTLGKNRSGRHTLKTMAVLGSGGHTAEMIQLLKSLISLEPRYAPRCYVVAETDAMSGKKAAIFEHQDVSQYSISYIPRSREVGQKYITSIFTTVWALLYAGIVVLRHRPRVLLVNGPGTCLPLVVWCRLASISGLIFHGCKVIYVESIARVDHLSLTGRIIYNLGLAHCFYVQWEELQAKLPRSLYVGRVY